MKPSHPPSVATWLLEHLRPETDESLVGDLVEEYAHGRSKAWYWRQVLCAFWVSFSAELYANLPITIKAVVTGWLAARLFEFAGLRIVIRFHLPPRIGTLPLVVGNGTAFGLTGLALCILVWVGSGWFTGRLYRRHLMTISMAFSISVFAFKLQSFPLTLRLLLGAVADPRYLQPFAFEAISLILPSILVVLGAFIASRSKLQGSLRHAY